MSTIEERFQAAVNVIRGLPKNGSYQPSNAMMLTFYAYFKQATQGPCRQKKPNFWDVVGRAKWDAWIALGDMSRERAMVLYVDELKKIIETMSYTENVANFMGSISELDNVNLDDLEAIAPEIMKKARSHPNSPFASRGSSPNHMQQQQEQIVTATTNGYNTMINGIQISGASGSDDDDLNITYDYDNHHDNNNDQRKTTKISTTNKNYLHQNGDITLEQSDDEYTDTVEDNIETTTNKKLRVHINPSNNRSESYYELTRERENLSNQILQQILMTVQKMNNDVTMINQRVNGLEKHIIEVRNMQTKQQKLTQYQQKLSRWWPLNGITPTWFVILILWPFVVQRLGRMLQRRK